MNAASTNEPSSEEPEVYAIPAHRMGKLDKKVEKFARKAAKLGVSPITYTVVGEKLVEEKDSYTGEKTGRVFLFKLVELEGEAPVVAGYTFVARTEHTPVGNILSKAPKCYDVEIPGEPKDAYYARLQEADPLTVVCKMCDRLDNLRSLEATDPAFQAKQAKETDAAAPRATSPRFDFQGGPQPRSALL